MKPSLKSLIAALALAASANAGAALIVGQTAHTNEIGIKIGLTNGDGAVYYLDTGLTIDAFLADANTSKSWNLTLDPVHASRYNSSLLTNTIIGNDPNVPGTIVGNAGNSRSINWWIQAIDLAPQPQVNGTVGTRAVVGLDQPSLAHLTKKDLYDGGNSLAEYINADQGTNDDDFIDGNKVNEAPTHSTQANGYALFETSDDFVTIGEGSISGLQECCASTFSGGALTLQAYFLNVLSTDTDPLNGSPLDANEITALPGTFRLDLDNGRVLYEVAAVPVPAAVWLLGSALLGIAGIGRRRGA